MCEGADKILHPDISILSFCPSHAMVSKNSLQTHGSDQLYILAAAIFIKHVVAVAAYIRLASRSQAKIFKTKEIETSSGFGAQPHLRRARHSLICHFDSRLVHVRLFTRYALNQWPPQERFRSGKKLTVAVYLPHQSVSELSVFLPEASFGLRVLSFPPCVSVYVCVSVNHELVRAIIHQPLNLGSPNLE